MEGKVNSIVAKEYVDNLSMYKHTVDVDGKQYVYWGKSSKFIEGAVGKDITFTTEPKTYQGKEVEVLKNVNLKKAEGGGGSWGKGKGGFIREDPVSKNKTMVLSYAKDIIIELARLGWVSKGTHQLESELQDAWLRLYQNVYSTVFDEPPPEEHTREEAF